jgi:hypothetical protein
MDPRAICLMKGMPAIITACGTGLIWLKHWYLFKSFICILLTPNLTCCLISEQTLLYRFTAPIEHDFCGMCNNFGLCSCWYPAISTTHACHTSPLLCVTQESDTVRQQHLSSLLPDDHVCLGLLVASGRTHGDCRRLHPHHLRYKQVPRNFL